MVLDRVMAAVPATPATKPFPYRGGQIARAHLLVPLAVVMDVT
jgi:hypothetical protein